MYFWPPPPPALSLNALDFTAPCGERRAKCSDSCPSPTLRVWEPGWPRVRSGFPSDLAHQFLGDLYSVGQPACPRDLPVTPRASLVPQGLTLCLPHSWVVFHSFIPYSRKYGENAPRWLVPCDTTPRMLFVPRPLHVCPCVCCLGQQCVPLLSCEDSAWMPSASILLYPALCAGLEGFLK